MARVHRGVTARARHKKVVNLAKGYRGRGKNVFRVAVERVEKGLQYAYRDRRVKKRNFRSLWIQRINAAARLHGLTYSQFMNGMKRDGLTASLYLSRELSKAIRGLPHELPERFQPSRKLISYKRKEEAIKATEHAYTGSDFQHGGVQAPYNIDRFTQARFAPIRAVYENRKIQNFGIHPELVHLYENDQYYEKIKHELEIK